MKIKIQTDDGLRDIEVDWDAVPRVGDPLSIGAWPRLKVAEVIWVAAPHEPGGVRVLLTARRA